MLFCSPVSSEDNLDHLSMEEKQRCKGKLRILGVCDPYFAPAALFKSLKLAKSLLELCVCVVICNVFYEHIVENCSPYTAAKMKGFKVHTITCVNNNNVTMWEVKNKKFSIVSKGKDYRHSYNKPSSTILR